MLVDVVFTVASVSAITTNILGLGNQPVKEHVIAHRTLSLENRYPNPAVNTVFKDNILLTTAYMNTKVKEAKDIEWDKVTTPFTYEFTLEPNKTFAFHSDVLPEYKEKIAKTTNAHFNAQEGFKFSGKLYGDGVCHLASIIYWVAKDAKLDAVAPTNHDFRAITDIPREYGVSIYSDPDVKGINARQNLYITNNKQEPLTFRFIYKDNALQVIILAIR